MDSYVTLSGTLDQLRKEGYVEDFNLHQNCLDCPNKRLKIFPGDFKVDKYFRFEGSSNPSDQAILYAISSEHHQLKGVLVNGYGIYSESLTDEMLEKLDIRR
jgi:hypothetical protein